MSDAELLKFAIENGMIDTVLVQEKIEMQKRKELLEKHPYSIWEGKNGLWYTYLPDAAKGRVLKKRKTEEAINDVVIKYWEEHFEKEEIVKGKKKSEITLFELFPLWLNYKQLHTNSTSYIKRITADWKKYYSQDKELIYKPINSLTILFLDEWAHNVIKKHNMTKKQYYNMSIILRQCLDYATMDDIKIVEENLFAKVKINSKLFRRVKKKTGSSEVYTTEEQPAIVSDMIRRFNNNPTSTAPLAVLLLFEIGVRIGELCALKLEDIEGNYIVIQRQEVREYEKVDDYTMTFKSFSIVEYTKSDDSYRAVYLTKTARALIEFVKQVNAINGEINKEGYIFVKDGQNINHYSIQAMLVRGCQAVGMSMKSAHKIRKTYISTLIDSGLNIDAVRRMAGHADERTTYGNYCYNRLTDSQTELVIESALNSEKVIMGNQLSLPA